MKYFVRNLLTLLLEYEGWCYEKFENVADAEKLINSTQAFVLWLADKEKNQ